MDPLAQLKDIHLPEQINNYPLAYGWWILAALIVLATAFFIKHLIQRRKRNKARNQALAHLRNNELSNNEIFELLKWACLQYFPREQVAKLYGQELQEFLRSRVAEKQQENFLSLIEPAISTQYQSPENQRDFVEHNQMLNQAAKMWLQSALPPKKQRVSVNEGDQMNSMEVAK